MPPRELSPADRTFFMPDPPSAILVATGNQAPALAAFASFFFRACQ